MRFSLKLEVENGNVALPLNYQYELSSWIFHTIHNSDNDFARWLHETGYCNRNRKFKLFTFSRLKPEKYRISGDRMIIDSRNTELIVSFYVSEAVEHFIAGVFKNQHLKLGDRISSADFYVRQIEKLPDISFSSCMKFRAISPLIVSHNTGVEEYARYLSPEDDAYPELLYNNLISKYVATAEFHTEDCNKGAVLSEQEFGFSLLGGIRQKLIRIKAGKSDETFLKGFEFEFKLTAPVELMRIGYYSGFGEKNSLGFGCVEVVET
ncbi:MAG TPA: CRISPR-associated endoribonuclease Cas6 [Bacteroidales bacterium]|nr:CRISPR-associated endoribonuclease Cas6 [Bacteroidales bacterium]HQG36370.1 CRISPR-associated endoribonuclease Cas6 [Bacteroidales bacterium]HQG52446.1 CRISPR-associated endoribonuclease Cas6 [Bacteroidales bacterium]HQJ19997.1 CRISPR-associated endoribonuclease Cas6 [Bacteroidales bacterium]HRC89809.1 CRISPR-associated endoribonuclease Cas6 [Bacteroidales bacterium]